MNDETQKRIEEIKERENKVKPGPFISGGHGFDGEYVAAEDGTLVAATRGPIKESWALAEFFAHARADIPWLLEQLIKKDETCDWLNMAIDGFRSQLDQTLKQLDEANAELKAQMISEDNVGESVRNRWMAIVAERDAEIVHLQRALRAAVVKQDWQQGHSPYLVNGMQFKTEEEANTAAENAYQNAYNLARKLEK